MRIHIPKPWALPEREVTPQSIYRSRREVLRSLGLGALSAASVGVGGCGLSVERFDLGGEGRVVTSLADMLPAPANDAFDVPERPLTAYEAATRYNNYYEFTTRKDSVWQLVGGFEVEPWTVEIGGLVHSPMTLSFEDLLSRVDLEERIYRFRCVERWAMTVPWTGFPLSALIAMADPMSSARYVAMETVARPSQQPGLEDLPHFPWPYFEALRLDEALNDLAFMVVGIYGEPLPVQNGAPLRLAVPWKYGYKSTKAIVRITLVEEQPPTFWNTRNAREYGFFSNVNPEQPHPRWSQAEEWLIPDADERRPTLLYNGYADLVADLYAGEEH